MNKKILVAGIVFALILITSIMFYLEPEEEIPEVPTIQTTAGYIQVVDYTFDFGYDYPEDWDYEIVDFHLPIEYVEVFTNYDGNTRMIISIKQTDFSSLAQVKGFGYISSDSIIEEKFVDINGRSCYVVEFTQYPDVKAKWVIFLVNGRVYTLEFYVTEDRYEDVQEIFDHVLNSFYVE